MRQSSRPPVQRSAGHSRKAAKLSESLQRDLSLYALAAASAGVSVLALAQPSEAQIVYTPAHEIIQRNGSMVIDLNHDGVPDLAIREATWTNPPFPGNSVGVETPKGGGILYSFVPAYAAPLMRGSIIGPSGPFHSGPEIMVQATDYGIYYGGAWSEDATNRFLGIRFKIGQETHYGWARLDIKLRWRMKDMGVLLTGYAYETQPDTPIRAGYYDTDSDDKEAGPAGQQFSSPKPEPSLGELALGALRRDSLTESASSSQ